MIETTFILSRSFGRMRQTGSFLWLFDYGKGRRRRWWRFNQIACFFHFEDARVLHGRGLDIVAAVVLEDWSCLMRITSIVSHGGWGLLSLWLCVMVNADEIKEWSDFGFMLVPKRNSLLFLLSLLRKLPMTVNRMVHPFTSSWQYPIPQQNLGGGKDRRVMMILLDEIMGMGWIRCYENVPPKLIFKFK